MGKEAGAEGEETHTFRFRAIQGYAVEEAGGYTPSRFEASSGDCTLNTTARGV